MKIEFRRIAPDEFDAFVRVDLLGFGAVAPAPDQPDDWARGELNRAFAAFVGGEIVGCGRNYSFELTVPGGATVPAGAVSWISVLPTHRRRGVLTGMMAALVEDSRAHGEPVSLLTASEGGIYNRFGYGVATDRAMFSIERAHGGFAREWRDPGSVRIVEVEEAVERFPAVYDKVRGTRAGMVSRPDFWWSGILREKPDPGVLTVFVVHEDRRGNADGYAWYHMKGTWELGVPAKDLEVVDLHATNAGAHRALWRYLLDVDLVARVRATNAAVDDPIRFLLSDSRRLRVDAINDGLWLRVLDLKAALEARSYATDGDLVLEVTGPGSDTQTVVLDSDAGRATCSRRKRRPDLSLTADALASVYLGGFTFGTLAAADRVTEHRQGALARADRLFATPGAPAMISYF